MYNESRDINAYRELNDIDKNIATAVIGRSMADRRKTLVSSDIAETNKEIRDRAKYIENIFKVTEDEAFKDTLQRLDNAFDSNDIDDVLDYLSGNTGVNLSDNVKDELDRINRDLNLFDESSEPIVDVISRHARLKARQKGQQPAAIVNNQPVQTPPVVAQNAEDASAETELHAILAQQEAAQERQFNASSKINACLLDKFLSNTDENLVTLDYDAQYSAIKDDLISQGYQTDIIDEILPQELRSIRYIYNSVQEMNNGEHASSIDLSLIHISEPTRPY